MRPHFLLANALALTIAMSAHAGDWPTYMADNSRSGISTDRLSAAPAEVWRYEARHAPEPAWPPPAERDIWHGHEGLEGAVQFDRAHQTVIVGGLLYFGSSTTDALVCLDALTGEPKWRSHTEGPVRLAPTIAGGRAYFGADDGLAYCLDARTGALVWKLRIAPDDRRIPGNGRIISDKPIRSGVLVDDGVAYCFAGIFPAYGVYGCAIDAATGELLWREKLDGVSPQGYLLASPDTLFVPSGRVQPVMVAKATGKAHGSLPSPGGAFALLTGDGLVSGPGRATGAVQVASTATQASIASFDGLRMVVNGDTAFLRSATRLTAIDRVRRAELVAAEQDTTAAEIWSRESPHALSLIVAGGSVVAGGDGEVLIVDAADGSDVASLPVEGRAYGLSVTDGRLYISTDRGVIHCFGAPSGGVRRIAPEASSGPGPMARVAAPLRNTRADQGYALVLDETCGAMALEIARQTRLRVVASIADPTDAARARQLLDEAGMHGSRVAVHAGSHGRYPYAGHLFNLIVSESTALPPRDLLRLLRPEGGVLWLGASRANGRPPSVKDVRTWIGSAPGCDVTKRGRDGVMVRRGALPGVGEWTSAYGNLANTAASADAVAGELALRWFGEPGPEPMIDRHHRAMSSLIANGRLIVPGNDVLIAADAYNGAPLWEREIAGLRRVGVGKNCGHIILDGDTIYAAVRDECWAIDAATGETLADIGVPTDGREWGYVGASGRMLIGSETAPGAAVSEHGRGGIALVYYDRTPHVVSESLFAIQRRAQALAWRYPSRGIVNSSIAIADDRVYFIEARGEGLEVENGRAPIDAVYASDAHLVALNARTGRVAWARPVSHGLENSTHLSVAEGVVLVTGSRNEGAHAWYNLAGHDAATGAELWRTTYDSGYAIGGSHGEQDQHPVIIAGSIYTRPFSFDLHTGEQRDYRFDRGAHGCGGISGSAHYIYGRGGNPRRYDTDADATSGELLTQTTRPGCWLNILAAGGMVLVPESSSGCTCGFAVQTSLALAPIDVGG